MSTEDRQAVLEAKIQKMEDQQDIFDCIKRNLRGNDRFDVELIASNQSTGGGAKHRSNLNENFRHSRGRSQRKTTG